MDPGFKTAVYAVRCQEEREEMSETKKRKAHAPEFKAKVGLEA